VPLESTKEFLVPAKTLEWTIRLPWCIAATKNIEQQIASSRIRRIKLIKEPHGQGKPVWWHNVHFTPKPP
jgi:hypothetical protein